MSTNGFQSLLLAIFAPLLALIACDAGILRLKPGVSTAADVRRALGQPAFEWKNLDGSYTWEFARGPEGTVTYMVDMGADDVLKAIRQVLSEEYFSRIQPGMTPEEVRRLIGRPGQKTSFPNLREEVSSWTYEAGPGDPWYFNVHFNAEGTVKRTSRQKAQSDVTPP